jgi:hypothetical protein
MVRRQANQPVIASAVEAARSLDGSGRQAARHTCAVAQDLIGTLNGGGTHRARHDPWRIIENSRIHDINRTAYASVAIYGNVDNPPPNGVT